MKRTIILFCFITIFLCFGLAASTEGMTPAQEREYLSKALSIQEVLSTSGKSSIFNIDGSAAFAFSDSSTNKKWEAYEGASPISKIDFFRLTGEPKLLEEALAIEERNEKRNKLGLGLTIGGSIGYFAGLGVMVYSVFDMENYVTILCSGAGISLLFAIPMCIGIDFLTTKEEQKVSASFAAGIADVYNKELEAKIKLSF